MTWTKLSDDFSDDCWRLSDKAFRLHVEGLIWSNRKLTDLRLDKNELRRWAKHPEVAAELVETGWWSDDGGHYLINHHGAYQRTREAVLSQQAVNKKNGKKGGRPPREQVTEIRAREANPETESLTESKTETDGTGQDGPVKGSGPSPQLALVAGAESWPPWRGSGPDPFNEYK